MDRHRGNYRRNNNGWVSRNSRGRGNPPPPHLKGKQIGMYYKHLYQNRPPGEFQTRKGKKEMCVKFGIPSHIEHRVFENLEHIKSIARKAKIHIPILKLPTVNDENNEHFAKIDTTVTIKPGPSTSNTVVKNETELKDDKMDIPETLNDKIVKSCSEVRVKTEKIEDDDIAKCSTLGIQEKIKTEQVESDEICEHTGGEDKIKTEKENHDEIYESSAGVKIKQEKADDKYEELNLNMSTESEDDSHIFRKPAPVCDIKTINSPAASTSSAPDLIQVPKYPKVEPKTEDDWRFYLMNPSGEQDPVSSDVGTTEQLLSLRGGGDYKYGYHDIITSTYDEKLEECLSKGIAINLANNDIKAVSDRLHNEYNAMLNKSGFIKMMKFRATLPTYKKRDGILNTLNNTQVLVISGETGCGKSTQVPQIILDDAMANKKGGNVHILVTQPRRIAASSLAQRVAQERGEALGNSVGYCVRLEKVDARSRGSIMFCTTGILLAELEVDQGLTNFSHIILDEVHERDCHIDISMCMLKKVLERRKDLKLILMSATIDAEKLSEYFDGCPMLHIEGLAYPVKDIYLEDILIMTNYQLPPAELNRKKSYMQREAKNKMEKEVQYRATIHKWLDPLLINRPELRPHKNTLIDPRIEDINMDLIVTLLYHICQGPDGAILVFLPGIGDITKLMKAMSESGRFLHPQHLIFPLHSKLPTLEQRQIFERPPQGTRKIIIATNIAETSITIDDVVYVVDSGKIKYLGLNVQENLSTLETAWVSKANLRQRRGRAGRCQPGICYHLLTSFRAENIAERLLPELQRSNLLEPVLTMKKMRLGKAADAMKLMPAPAADATVDWAVSHLQQCGALNAEEKLTPLGWHLARLPLHPSAGKLVLLGALFGVLDRAASVAAVWGFKDPFQLVIGKENEVDQAKRYFAMGEPSDHVALSECIIHWEHCSPYSRRKFAFDHFLSNSTLELLSEMKKQLGENLKHMGFLASGNIKSVWENRNDKNLSLFKALVAASLYPNIATVRWSNSRNPHKRKTIQVNLPNGGKVAIHPSSVMTYPNVGKKKDNIRKLKVPMKLCENPGANWLVYWLKQKTSDVFLLEVTLVYTLPLLFFGELKIKAINATELYEDVNQEGMCMMSISNIKVQCKRSTAQLLFELRSLLDQVLASKVMVEKDYKLTNSEFQDSVLKTVSDLITAEDERQVSLGDDDDNYSESDASDSY